MILCFRKRWSSPLYGQQLFQKITLRFQLECQRQLQTPILIGSKTFILKFHPSKATEGLQNVSAYSTAFWAGFNPPKSELHSRKEKQSSHLTPSSYSQSKDQEAT
jgi:hypothetical protein